MNVKKESINNISNNNLNLKDIEQEKLKSKFVQNTNSFLPNIKSDTNMNKNKKELILNLHTDDLLSEKESENSNINIKEKENNKKKNEIINLNNSNSVNKNPFYKENMRNRFIKFFKKNPLEIKKRVNSTEEKNYNVLKIFKNNENNESEIINDVTSQLKSKEVIREYKNGKIINYPVNDKPFIQFFPRLRDSKYNKKLETILNNLSIKRKNKFSNIDYQKLHLKNKHKWKIIRAGVNLILLFLSLKKIYKGSIKIKKEDSIKKRDLAQRYQNIRSFFLKSFDNIHLFCKEHFCDNLLSYNNNDLNEKNKNLYKIKLFIHLFFETIYSLFAKNEDLTNYIKSFIRELISNGKQLPLNYLTTFEFNRLEFNLNLQLINMTLERQALLISYLIFYRFFIFDILNNITTYFPELIKEKSVESIISNKTNTNMENLIPPSCPPKNTDKSDFIDDDALTNKTNTKTFKLAQSVIRYKYDTKDNISIKKEIMKDHKRKNEREKSVKFNLKDDDNKTNKTKKSKKKKTRSRKATKNDGEFCYDLEDKKILSLTKSSLKKKNKRKKRKNKEKSDNETESNDNDNDNYDNKKFIRYNKRNKSRFLYNNNDNLTKYKNNSYSHYKNMKNSYTQTQLPYNNNSYNDLNQNNNNKALIDSIYNKINNDLNKPYNRNIIYNGENPYNNCECFIPYARPVKLPFINYYNDYNNQNFNSFNCYMNCLYRRNCCNNSNYNLYPINSYRLRNNTSNMFSNNNCNGINFPMTDRNNSNSIFYNNYSQQYSNSLLKSNSQLNSKEFKKQFLPNLNSSTIKNDSNKMNNINSFKLFDDKFNINNLKIDKKKKTILEKNLLFIVNILNYIISSKLRENINIYHEGYKEQLLYKLMVLNKKNERYFNENDENELMNEILFDSEEIYNFIRENYRWLQLYKISSYQFGIDIAQRCMDKYNY